MKSKFIKLILSGVISIGVLAYSSTVFAMEVNSNSKQVDANKNIVLLAQKDGMEDGKYNVSIQTLKEKTEELSMAGQYIDSNAVLDVEGGKMYLTVKVLRNDWMKNIRVLVDEGAVNYKNNPQDNEGKVVNIKFEIPDKKSNIKFKMNVVPMGNADVGFRVALNNITKTEGSTSKSNSNNKVDSKSNEKELPQTGFPISNCNLLIMGGVSTLLGVGLFKKRK